MSITFTTKAIPASKSPTVADVQEGQAFSTDFGTVYIKASSQFVKLGNPTNEGHNNVAVKPASYFGSGSRNVTLLGDLQVAI